MVRDRSVARTRHGRPGLIAPALIAGDLGLGRAQLLHRVEQAGAGADGFVDQRLIERDPLLEGLDQPLLRRHARFELRDRGFLLELLQIEVGERRGELLAIGGEDAFLAQAQRLRDALRPGDFGGGAARRRDRRRPPERFRARGLRGLEVGIEFGAGVARNRAPGRPRPP